MATATNGELEDHPVVSHEKRLAARTAFLAKEKAYARGIDLLNTASNHLDLAPKCVTRTG